MVILIWRKDKVKQEAESMVATLENMRCFFATVTSAPSFGAFSDLHTTMSIRNVEQCPLLDLWDFDASVLTGSSDNPSIKSAVHGLAKILAETDQTSLARVLNEHASEEKEQMVYMHHRACVGTPNRVPRNCQQTCIY